MEKTSRSVTLNPAVVSEHVGVGMAVLSLAETGGGQEGIPSLHPSRYAHVAVNGQR
jgi:hypothetical protein